MTGLSNSYPAAPIDADDAEVVADGWFPPVTLARVRALAKLGGAVTSDELTLAIEGGMLSAFRELAAWRSARVLAGAAMLADVTTLQLNGRNQAEALWERIVAFYAKADLYADDTDISPTDQGMDRGEEKACRADEARRQAYAAQADLLSIGADKSVPRNMVRMI